MSLLLVIPRCLAHYVLINIVSYLITIVSLYRIAGCNGAGCGYPGAPAHSSVRFTGPDAEDVIDEEDSLLKDTVFPEGTVATYSCERGFELLGPARRQCQIDGSWTPDGVPFCGEPSYLLKLLQIACNVQIWLQFSSQSIDIRDY